MVRSCCADVWSDRICTQAAPRKIEYESRGSGMTKATRFNSLEPHSPGQPARGSKEEQGVYRSVDSLIRASSASVNIYSDLETRRREQIANVVESGSHR